MKNKLIYYIAVGGETKFFIILNFACGAIFIGVFLVVFGIFYPFNMLVLLIPLVFVAMMTFIFFYTKKHWAGSNIRYQSRMQEYSDLIGKECTTIAVEEHEKELYIAYSLGLGRGNPTLGRNSSFLLRTEKFKFTWDVDNKNNVIIEPTVKDAYSPGDTYHKVLTLDGTFERLFIDN